MTRICNFPIDWSKRCTQPVADGRPNCGRHHCEVSAQQIGQDPVIYEWGGELHVWAGKPDGLYCLIHSDSAYQVLYQLAGEKAPYCLREAAEWADANDEFHRDDGPAEIRPDGTQKWYQHGQLHRDDGPAVIWSDGSQEWYQHGEYHRDDGPAIIYANGTQKWYQHDQLHRDDGPAVVRSDNTQKWYRHGQLHREDGPAWIDPDGSQEWYLYGVRRKANQDVV
jgi:hypothetical protein